MNAASAACRRAVLEADPRLVEALYLCQVQAAAEALSGVYAVLGRRRARILQEELREGSGAFLVHAYLPVEASFGLADEMRRRSSGAASASLLLSHWERLQVCVFSKQVATAEQVPLDVVVCSSSGSLPCSYKWHSLCTQYRLLIKCRLQAQLHQSGGVGLRHWYTNPCTHSFP